MNIDSLKTKIPDYAKDIKLNLSSLLQGSEPLQLSNSQIGQMALVAAYATNEKTVIQSLESFAEQQGITNEEKNAVKAAASLMAMNNVYYRSIHFLSADTYQKLSAGLRMHMLQRHGINQKDFEMLCVVVSAINGCERCLTSHVAVLEKAGIGTNEIHYGLRLASVIKGLAQVMTIETTSSK